MAHIAQPPPANGAKPNSWLIPVFLGSLMGFLGMLLFEVLKDTLAPQNLSLWESHWMTIGFSTLAAAVISYFQWRRSTSEAQRIAHERQIQFEIVQRNESMLQGIMDNTNAIVYVKDLDGRYLRMNQVWSKEMARPIDSSIGKSDTELFGAEQAAPWIANDTEVLRQGLPVTREETFSPARTFVAAKFLLKDTSGKPYALCGLSTEITALKEAEAGEHRMRALLKNIIDSMPSVLVGVDPEMRVTQWNWEAERLTGISAKQAFGQPVASVIPQLQAKLELVTAAIRERSIKKQQKANVHSSGKPGIMDITVFPLVANCTQGAVIRMDDVTERVRLEEMMIQSEKMFSIGGLAAGMAHEINNPLAGMLQNAQVVINRIAPDRVPNKTAAEKCGLNMTQLTQYLDLREIPLMLQAIRESGERAATIVHNMLSFSRRSTGGKSLESIHTLLEATLKLAENDYDLKKKYDFRKIDIQRQYAENLPSINCNRTEIQQVFLNLLKNSAQALAEKQDCNPKIVLRTGVDGSRIRIDIEDNGPGISDEVRVRIFEPFFTTKPVGSGTGLGLSVSFFIIVENHGGSLDVSSVVGSGTTFSIFLPIQSAD